MMQKGMLSPRDTEMTAISSVSSGVQVSAMLSSCHPICSPGLYELVTSKLTRLAASNCRLRNISKATCKYLVTACGCVQLPSASGSKFITLCLAVPV